MNTESLKKSLRINLLEARNRLTKKVRVNYDQLIISHIVSKFSLNNKKIASYKAMGSEVDLSSLEQSSSKSNIFIFPAISTTKSEELPIVRTDFGFFRDQILTFRDGTCGFSRSKHGFLEPSLSAKVYIPDIIFTPLIGYDITKNRIGYGKGFYDITFNYLEKIRLKEQYQGNKLLKVGVAYSCQEVKIVPTEIHDIKLDLIITEKGIIE